jgi:hypothetical protein
MKPGLEKGENHMMRKGMPRMGCRALAMIVALGWLVACGGDEGNTKLAPKFSGPKLMTLKIGASEAMVREELGAPLHEQRLQGAVTLDYSEPKDASKPYVIKRVRLQDGKVIQKFDEPSAVE